MAQQVAITRLEDGKYQVALRRGGAEEVTVGPLASQEQADLVCDLLTIKAALDNDQSLAALQLRSQAGPPTFQLSLRAAKRIGRIDWAGLVEELQGCAQELQDDYWHAGEASPGCSAAGMLLLAAAALGNACAAQLLLLLQRDAAAARGGAAAVAPLHLAAEEGHTAIMRAILSAMPAAMDLRSGTDSSALHHAAMTAQPAAVRLLLKVAPAAVAQPSLVGVLPLHMAAVAKVDGAEDEEAVGETIRLLLEAAPETALAGDQDGELALHWAALSGSEAAVRALLKGAPAAALEAKCSGMLPVHKAAACGTPAALRLLLDAQPDSITATDGDEGQQPIHWAAKHGNTAAVATLLATRPGIASAGDTDGGTAAHYAASSDAKLPVLQLLMAAAPNGSCALVRDADGHLPAHVAAEMNCPAALRCLFASAPSVPQALATDNDDAVPLHLAAEHGSVAAAEVLLEVAPEACHMRNSAGMAPLSTVAWYGQEAMVSLLLAAAPQAALIAEEDNGDLPIHIAAGRGHATVVAQLLAAHPDLATTVTAECRTPLSVALQYCQDTGKRDAVARVLLPAGSASLALESLEEEAELDSQHLLPDFVGTRLPLSDDVWAQLARPCPGLGPLLPAALAHGTEQAQQLVRHLPAADAAQLRLAALCLARAQRRTGVHLPPAITGVLLSLSCG